MGTEYKTEGVSIVVPVYNEEGGVGSFLEALLSEVARGGRPWELLVVDDGSTDRTRDRIEAYAEKIRILQHRENRGYGAAIKTGIQAARFPIVLIVDADGTYPTEAIPRLLGSWDEGTEMVVGASAAAAEGRGCARAPAASVARASTETLTCPKSAAARSAKSSVTRTPFVVRFGVIPRARAASAIASRSGRASASPPPIATWKTRRAASASRRAIQSSSDRSVAPSRGELSW